MNTEIKELLFHCGMLLGIYTAVGVFLAMIKDYYDGISKREALGLIFLWPFQLWRAYRG